MKKLMKFLAKLAFAFLLWTAYEAAGDDSRSALKERWDRIKGFAAGKIIDLWK